MPTINALTGSVRLLKADERILTQAVALVDCLVENFDQLFLPDADDAEQAAHAVALSEAFEHVREPLGLIARRVEARLKPAEKAAEQQGEQAKPKIANAG